MPKRKYIEREDGMVFCPKCNNWHTQDHFLKTVDKNGKNVGMVRYYCTVDNRNFNSGGRNRRKGNNFPYNSKEYIMFYRLPREFGITLEDYNNMLIIQNNSCGICKIKKHTQENILCVDHNHNTGKVRGLLCKTCNSGIGNLMDSIDILNSCISYLEKEDITFSNNSTFETYDSKKSDNSRYFRDKMLQKNFNISLIIYDELLKSQNFVCGICKNKEIVSDKNGKIRSLSVDHCHSTGKIRGLLCQKCNKGIGLLKDNITIIKNAINYLENNAI